MKEPAAEREFIGNEFPVKHVVSAAGKHSFLHYGPAAHGCRLSWPGTDERS